MRTRAPHEVGASRGQAHAPPGPPSEWPTTTSPPPGLGAGPSSSSRAAATAAAYWSDPHGSGGGGVAPKPGRSGARVGRAPPGAAGPGRRRSRRGCGASRGGRPRRWGLLTPGLAVQRPTGERAQHPGEATSEAEPSRPSPGAAHPPDTVAAVPSSTMSVAGPAALLHGLTAGAAGSRHVAGHPAVRPRRGRVGQDDGAGPPGGAPHPRRLGRGRAHPGGDLHPQGVARAPAAAHPSRGDRTGSRPAPSTRSPSPSSAGTGPTGTTPVRR